MGSPAAERPGGIGALAPMRILHSRSPSPTYFRIHRTVLFCPAPDAVQAGLFSPKPALLTARRIATVCPSHLPDLPSLRLGCSPPPRSAMLRAIRRAAVFAAELLHPGLMRLMMLYARLRYGPNAHPYTVFPQRPAGARNTLGSSGELHPDPIAPDCIPVAEDTAGWVDTSPSIPTTRASRITLRVPPAYKAQYFGSVTEEPGEHWGHILGSWQIASAEQARSGYPECDFTLWIGSEVGYPTLGTSPEAHQFDFAECQVRTSQPTLHLVRFTLRTPDQGVRHYIAATWTVAPGVHIQAAGSGPDLHAQNELVAIAQSLRIAAP
jgi:hypothetical protein